MRKEGWVDILDQVLSDYEQILATIFQWPLPMQARVAVKPFQTLATLNETAWPSFHVISPLGFVRFSAVRIC